ncbi:MAG: glycosyltransferase 87 family protein [Solirubrobacterales bacterium]
MSQTAKWIPALALVVAASAWISFTPLMFGAYPAYIGPGDYPIDAAQAVSALANGEVGDFLSLRPVMGPFSIILRAPFAALGDGQQLGEYRWGSFACVLAAGLLGLYLARIARRLGSTGFVQVVIVAACLFNPLTFAALDSGHPEEILTASLAVGAVAVASQGHAARAALLLGLALASKQWAVIAVFPVLMALPDRRLRAALGAAAVALVLTLPGFLVDPGGFLASQRNAASTHSFVDPWSVWYPIAGSVPGVVAAGSDGVITGEPFEGGSEFLGRYAHSLIVLTAIALPLALAVRRRGFELSGADAMALLALLALLRSALDPVNNVTYHEPLLLALVGWDALENRGPPVRALAGAALALLFWRLWLQNPDPAAFNAAYIAVVVPLGLAIARSLLRPGARKISFSGIRAKASTA